MLDRVGAAISDNQTIKSTPQKAIKKRADAYGPQAIGSLGALALAANGVFCSVDTSHLPFQEANA
jgi:hypothetical protein